ncbi:ABC transporter substrate-binding protein [Microbacterium sp. NPDC089698]|jgi:peptide/nickel transport system substrate-binding protein|uniref:ABC transporter substrate-binding protein n=1 Tax=unclassified Microbacterium TaxID=2609290 RepID=UPI00282E9A25|nr:ABC transporter substrate-binding protein [Microbacterium sp.]MDR2323158.1 ABC transporter substrate-binding protein [Microbacterium sp.]
MRHRTPLIAILGATALVLTSCAGGGAAGAGKDAALANGKTFTQAIATDPGSLDPFITAMSVARGIDRFLYGRLVSIKEDGGVASGLAEKWTADTTTATFTLRDKLTCEDGTPLKASDVAANISHVVDPATASPLVGLEVQPGTTAVGDDATRTVTVTSGHPDAFLLQNIGNISIVCGTVLKDPKALAAGKGSTGMFTMTEITPNSQYTLTRRKDFVAGGWDPNQKGLPDKAVFRVIPNETTAANLVMSGEVNAAGVVGPDQQRLQNAKLFSTHILAPAGQLIYNQASGRATADPAVRKALTQAVDLDQARQVFAGEVPTGFVTVAPNPCRADTVKGNIPGFDAKAAGAALDAAGWKLGSDGVRAKDGKPLTLKMVYASVLGDTGTAAVELLQSMWKKIGVDVTVKSLDGPSISETLLSTGDWDISGAGVTVGLPTSLVPFVSGPTPPNGSNFASIDDPDYVAAVAAASAKAGTEGCDDWAAAEKSLLTTSSVVLYATIARHTFANKATFTEGDGIDPTSIRMYE